VYEKICFQFEVIFGLDTLGNKSWLDKHGDNCTRLSFAKIKQRKLATYIYTIRDMNGNHMKGFDQVVKAKSDYTRHFWGNNM